MTRWLRVAASACAIMALAASVSGCAVGAFTTTDVYRPLVLTEFPNEARQEALRRDHFPEADADQIRESFRFTRAAHEAWVIHKYQSYFADLDIGRLVDALRHYGDNPFAWTQLGAYMALQHRPEAAARATERALDILDGLGAGGEAPELAELRRVSAINLAIYRNAGGQPEGALRALARLGPPDALTNFHQLAYQWTAAQAYTAMGDVASSREALSAARRAVERGLEPIPGRGDYPQYFQANRREAMFRFLEASNLRTERRYPEALGALNEALRGPRSVSDHDLLDARFLRALVFVETGNLDRAVSELEDLTEQVPRKLFRREAVFYHLALVRIEREELGGARNALARAVEITRHGNGVLRKQLARAVSSPAAGSELPEALRDVLRSAYVDAGWVYAPAFEALGGAYLEAFSAAAGGDPRLAAEGERMFEVALGRRGFPEDRDRLLPDAESVAGWSQGEGESAHFSAGSGMAASSFDSRWARIDGDRGPEDGPGALHLEARSRALVRLARIHWSQDDRETALTSFSEALAFAPGDRRTLAALMEAGSRATEPGLARRTYDLLLESLPLEAAPFGVDERLGEELERALADDPTAEGTEELEHVRARLLLLRGDLGAAETAFRAAERAYPDALWPATGRAWIDLNRVRADPVKAARRLERALGSDAGTGPGWQRRDAHFVQGELLLRAGDPAGALDAFDVAAELEPSWRLANEGVRLAGEILRESRPEGDG